MILSFFCLIAAEDIQLDPHGNRTVILSYCLLSLWHSVVLGHVLFSRSVPFPMFFKNIPKSFFGNCIIAVNIIGCFEVSFGSI